MSPEEHAWFHIENEADIATPALLFYRERIEHNLQLMLSIAGSPDRLRPHVKTHKVGQLIPTSGPAWHHQIQMLHHRRGRDERRRRGKDIMLAMPAVGANAHRLAELALKFPEVRFSTIADDEETIRFIAAAAQQHQVNIPVYLELDCGMARTGIIPGFQAKMLAHVIKETPRLGFAGLHAYDGHIHDADLETRRQRCDEAFAPILEFKKELQGEGLIVRELVAGGSPTFGIHAEHADRTLSPAPRCFGTLATATSSPTCPSCPPLCCSPASSASPARTASPSISATNPSAPENPHPRVRLEEIPEAEFIMQSERHTSCRSSNASAS